jgi:hypothetical protein
MNCFAHFDMLEEVQAWQWVCERYDALDILALRCSRTKLHNFALATYVISMRHVGEY